jgi:hypothetical protein
MRRIKNFIIGTIENVTGGGFKGEASAGETIQSGASWFLQHFGFHSKPPAGTVCAIAENDSGYAACVAEQSVPPVDVASGETCVFDETGSYAIFKGTTINIISRGDVKIENESGKYILLHESGALAAARGGISPGGDSVNPKTAFVNQWNMMVDLLGALKVDVLALWGASGLPGDPSSDSFNPPVYTSTATQTHFISEGSSNVKIG